MKFIRLLLSLLYPISCPECGKVLYDGNYWCKLCFIKNSKYALLNSSFNKYLDGCYTLSHYSGGIRKLIIGLKYSNKKSGLKAINCLFERFIYWERLKKCEIAIPIPLSKKRMHERGYNQVDLIFENVIKQKNIKYCKNILLKTRNTEVQSKLLKEVRKNNVKKSFAVAKDFNLKGKNVLLLDDIYTSGYTMKEAAKVLKQRGVKSVIGLVLSSGAK